MSRETVEHDVDIEVFGHVKFDELEEGEDIGRLVGLLGIEQDLPGAHVHDSEQIGGTVTLVVMSPGRTSASLHVQRGLGAIQGLGLRSSRRN